MSVMKETAADKAALVGVLDDLDLSIDETVFASPGDDTTGQNLEAFTTFGTTCWSCNSCSCSDSCTVSCNC